MYVDLIINGIVYLIKKYLDNILTRIEVIHHTRIQGEFNYDH